MRNEHFRREDKGEERWCVRAHRTGRQEKTRIKTVRRGRTLREDKKRHGLRWCVGDAPYKIKMTHQGSVPRETNRGHEWLVRVPV